MNRRLAWYRVPELWLAIALLFGSVAGSLVLAHLALSHPDRPTTTSTAKVPLK